MVVMRALSIKSSGVGNNKWSRVLSIQLLVIVLEWHAALCLIGCVLRVPLK